MQMKDRGEFIPSLLFLLDNDNNLYARALSLTLSNFILIKSIFFIDLFILYIYNRID